jgi:hypothetical protein
VEPGAQRGAEVGEPVTEAVRRRVGQRVDRVGHLVHRAFHDLGRHLDPDRPAVAGRRQHFVLARRRPLRQSAPAGPPELGPLAIQVERDRAEEVLDQLFDRVPRWARQRQHGVALRRNVARDPLMRGGVDVHPRAARFEHAADRAPR